MSRFFGQEKDKTPPPTIDEITGRLILRGDTLDERINNLDQELLKYEDMIKKTRPGPTQESAKRRAMNVLKQKRMYENQRYQLYQQQFSLESVAFTTQQAKDSVETITALKQATKEVKSALGHIELDIGNINNLNDEMADLMAINQDIQDVLGQSCAVTDDIDQSEFLGELDALCAELAMEAEAPQFYVSPPPKKMHKINKLNDEMADLMAISQDIQDVLGHSYAVPDDIDQSEFMGELDALYAELAMEAEVGGTNEVPAYLQDLLPDVPVLNVNDPQKEDAFGLPIDGVYHINLEVWEKIGEATVNKDTADNLKSTLELKEQVLKVVPMFADSVVKGAMKMFMEPTAINDVMEAARMVPWIGDAVKLSSLIFMGVCDVYENKKKFNKLSEFIASILETLANAPTLQLKRFIQASENVNKNVSDKFTWYLARGVMLVQRFTKRSSLGAFLKRGSDDLEFQTVQQGLNQTLILILLNMQMMPSTQQQPAIQTNNNTSEKIRQKITKLGDGNYKAGQIILSSYVEDTTAPKNSSINEILELMPYKILEGQEYTPRGS